MLHTKLHFLRISFLLFLLSTISYGLKAQVTIGASEKPLPGSLLQLKELTDITDDSYNAYNGLALPRVMLSNKKALYPMFLTDPADPTSGPIEMYNDATKKAAVDKEHTGLIVYNLVEDKDENLCVGLNQWDGEQWKCFQTKMENAKFAPLDCADITINGVYVEGTPTDGSNSIDLKLDVLEAGAYSITVTTNNGYNFYVSGIALNVGIMNLTIPGQGTPIAVQMDKLAFTGIELVAGCEPEIEVVSSIAKYSLNCSSVVVNGEYLKGQVLNSTNTIQVSILVSAPGSYSISTPKTNGISFAASGDFTVGNHIVTLIGTGTPTVNVDFPVTINANTQEGNGTCEALIPVTLPPMTYGIIGYGVWSWNTPARRTALDNGNSFGPNGVVRIKKLTMLWDEVWATNAVNRLNGSQEFPDVVLYFAYGVNPTVELTNALKDYINKGGCVIYGSADLTSDAVNLLLDGIFGIKTAIPQQNVHVGDDVYRIANLPNDPVINGPFANLSSLHWGEDNNSVGSVIMTSLPPNSVQVCSARSEVKPTQDPQYSIVWYNDSKNFLFIGDSVGASTTDVTSSSYPAKYTSSGLPESKYYGYDGQFQFVYNSFLELNAVAWALKKAAVSGINPH